jgi:GNAT superfamily N-acetyltransferase
MTLTTEFKKPEITGSFDWQLTQEINVKNEQGDVIAKAEIELITLNKHRAAVESYELLDSDNEATDWEIPLNLYFKGQNLSPVMCELLAVTANTKKAQTHIMLEALSVVPSYRKQGVAKQLLNAIANQYEKAQSITLMSMPMNLFVDAEDCQTPDAKSYYQALELKNDETSRDDLQQFFVKAGFINYEVDASLLAEPLGYDIYVSTPEKLLA